MFSEMGSLVGSLFPRQWVCFGTSHSVCMFWVPRRAGGFGVVLDSFYHVLLIGHHSILSITPVVQILKFYYNVILLQSFLVSPCRDEWNQLGVTMSPQQSLHISAYPTVYVLYIIASNCVKNSPVLSLVCLTTSRALLIPVRSKFLSTATRCQPSMYLLI